MNSLQVGNIKQAVKAVREILSEHPTIIKEVRQLNDVEKLGVDVFTKGSETAQQNYIAAQKLRALRTSRKLPEMADSFTPTIAKNGAPIAPKNSDVANKLDKNCNELERLMNKGGIYSKKPYESIESNFDMDKINEISRKLKIKIALNPEEQKLYSDYSWEKFGRTINGVKALDKDSVTPSHLDFSATIKEIRRRQSNRIPLNEEQKSFLDYHQLV